MELRQLEYVIDAATSKSFSQTAKKCFTTQQAVSKAIQSLETELGFRLFERTHSGVEPSAQCEEYFKGATRVLQEAARLQRIADDIRSGVDRTVRICFPFCSVASENGAVSYKTIERFEKACERRAVTYEEQPSHVCVEGVLSEAYDFGVSVGPPDRDDLEYELLHRCACKALVSNDNPLSKRALLSFEDLGSETIVPPPDRGYSLAIIETLCRNHGFEPNIGDKFDQLNTIIESTYANKGITFIMDNHESLIDPGKATLIPLEPEEGIVIPLYLIWKPGTDGEQLAKLFKECKTSRTGARETQ